MSYCIFPEWRFHAGSFCLVSHEGLNGFPLEECTRDRYWKARIVEIWRPKRNSKATCNDVSTKMFTGHYLTSYHFRNIIYWCNGFTLQMMLGRSSLMASRIWTGNVVILRLCLSTDIVFNQVFGSCSPTRTLCIKP